LGYLEEYNISNSENEKEPLSLDLELRIISADILGYLQ
jgi:hypothetical protein